MSTKSGKSRKNRGNPFCMKNVRGKNWVKDTILGKSEKYQGNRMSIGDNLMSNFPKILACRGICLFVFLTYLNCVSLDWTGWMDDWLNYQRLRQNYVILILKKVFKKRLGFCLWTRGLSLD